MESTHWKETRFPRRFYMQEDKNKAGTESFPCFLADNCTICMESSSHSKSKETRHSRLLEARLDSARRLFLPHSERAGRFGRMAGYGAQWKEVPGKFRGSGIALVHKKDVFTFARSERRNKDTRFCGLKSPSRVFLMEKTSQGECLRVFVCQILHKSSISANIMNL